MLLEALKILLVGYIGTARFLLESPINSKNIFLEALKIPLVGFIGPAKFRLRDFIGNNKIFFCRL